MSKITEQIAALTKIRELAERHFPEQNFSYIEGHLIYDIAKKRNEEIVFDEEQHAYKFQTIPMCKVCARTSSLIEIPTQTGSFFLCNKCKREIAAAEAV